MTKSSNTNARNAVSVSIEHRYPWRWELSDLEKVEKNGLKVFSTFACGGGSSMGYKLAGYDVIGCCEIDQDMIALYRKNNHPKYSYLMDVRDFVKLEDLPEELYDLDVLDGSPPCSVFSMAGKRERGWNTEKVFREGQSMQRLDDLFFSYIEIAEKLKPKVCVAENVKGLILNKARGYVNEIVKAFDAAGYSVQIFLLNSSRMGVPQNRERVFFIAQRKDLDPVKLKMSFNEAPILFGDVRSEHGIPAKEDTAVGRLAKYIRPDDRSMDDVARRVRRKNAYYTITIDHDENVAHTITSSGNIFRSCDRCLVTDQDIISCQTFPVDYDFGKEKVQYVCGMSVPPVMMAHVAEAIRDQIFSKR